MKTMHRWVEVVTRAPTPPHPNHCTSEPKMTIRGGILVKIFLGIRRLENLPRNRNDVGRLQGELQVFWNIEHNLTLRLFF